MAKKRINYRNMPEGYNLLFKYAFLVLLFASPFFKRVNLGSSFYIFVILLGVIVLVSTRNNVYKFDHIDWVFLALCCSYGLSIFIAESPRMALLGFIWQLGYFLGFIGVRNIFTTHRDKKIITYIVIASLSIITLLSILSKLGINTLSELVVDGRLAGTFYYSNAYAALLTSAILMAYVLFLEDEKKEGQLGRLKVLRAFIIFLLTVALFLTASRGGLLVFGVMSVVLILFARHKIHMGLTYLGINILGFLSAYGIEQLMQASQISRIVNAGNAGYSSALRFIFYQDGLKIFRDNWLLGTGVGGWEFLYPLYQPFQYHSQFVHSSIIQSLVDVGLVGTVLLLVLCLITVYKIYLNWKSGFSPVEKAAALGFFALSAHSVIDFDLSLPMVSVYFFIFMGLSCGQPTQSKAGFKAPVAILSGTLVVSCLIFGLGDLNVIAADKLVMADKADSAQVINKLQKALRFDPLNARIMNALGERQASWGAKNKDTKLVQDSLGFFDKAIKLEPNNYKGYLAKGKVLADNGNYEEAIQQYEKIITLMPYQNTGYEFMMRTYVTRAIAEGNADWAKKAVTVHSRAVKQDETIAETYKNYVSKDNLLAESLMINFHLGVANVIIGEYQAGSQAFSKIREQAMQPLQAEIEAWLYVTQNKLNIKTTPTTINSQLVEGIEDILSRF